MAAPDPTPQFTPRLPGSPSERGSDGAFERSWRLLKASAALARSDQAARRLFVAGTLINFLAATVVFLPAGRWAQDQHAAWPILLTVVVTAWPLTFLGVFCNVALLHVVDRLADGQPATARDGLRSARNRITQIAAWSLLATGVGLLLDVIAERVPFGGRLLSWMLGVAWSLSTLFAVPILALDGCGPRDCFQRSATEFRRRWGDGVAGNVAIFACLLVVTIPASIAFTGGILGGGESTGSVIATIVGWSALMLAALVAAAQRNLFALALWRGDAGLPGYDAGDLANGLKLKPRGLRAQYRATKLFSKHPDDY